MSCVPVLFEVVPLGVKNDTPQPLSCQCQCQASTPTSATSGCPTRHSAHAPVAAPANTANGLRPASEKGVVRPHLPPSQPTRGLRPTRLRAIFTAAKRAATTLRLGWRAAATNRRATAAMRPHGDGDVNGEATRGASRSAAPRSRTNSCMAPRATDDIHAGHTRLHTARALHLARAEGV